MDVLCNQLELRMRIVDAQDFLGHIQEFTLFTGRMKPLPSWITEGAVLGLEGGEIKVKQILQKVSSVPQLPISAVWIQDWSGQRDFGSRVGVWWNWIAFVLLHTPFFFLI